MDTSAHREMLSRLEAELGVELSLGYIGNTYGNLGTPAWRDDRSWSVDVTSIAVPRHLAERRGRWSHRASGISYPMTSSWTTDAFPTVAELERMVRDRIALELAAAPAPSSSERWEVVHATTRESAGYFANYVDAADAADHSEPGEFFEVWTVADDATRTRMVRHGVHRARGTSGAVA
jgi:hypothetical protein